MIVLCLAVAACGSEDPEVRTEVPQPLLADIQEKVFSPGCAAFSSCHSTTGHAGRCDLTAGSAWTSLVGKTANSDSSRVLVVPGHPEQSFLIAKLRGALANGEGERMPLRNPPLSEETIQAIEAWIASGAPAD